jgi:23S rRNA (adenine2503-C2)-methyltransferase
MKDILELDLKDLESELGLLGAPAYHAKQIFSWIYKRRIFNFSQMSDLPHDLRRRLKEEFNIINIGLAKFFESLDGTQKFLLKLSDNNLIEAVIIPAQGRVTACLSSQVGCRFACSFCASGLLGFKRNLEYNEILEELLILDKYSRGGEITHVVFMGTGEPFDNYDNVIKAIRRINAKQAFNIGARRITISTNGIISGINRLVKESLQVELSVSLHAGNDALRNRLMPVNKKFCLTELINACKIYSSKTNRQVTFEYILIKGVNSDLEDAKGLVNLLKGYRLAKVNLIPSNSIKELSIEPADYPQIKLFKEYLIKHGINVTLRRERGKDIDAACGQLRLRYEDSKNKFAVIN